MSNLFDSFSFGKDDSRVYFSNEGEFVGEFKNAHEEQTSWTNKDGDAIRVMVYTFVCQDGKTRSLWSGSKRLFGQMKKANPQVGDRIKITKLGEGMNTQYFVKHIDETEATPIVTPKNDLPF